MTTWVISCYFLPFSAYSPQNKAQVFDVPKLGKCVMPIVFHRQGQPRKHPCAILASPLQNRLHTTNSTRLNTRLGSLPICQFVKQKTAILAQVGQLFS